MSRIQEITSKIPAVTTALIIINCAVHVVVFIFSINVMHLAINWRQVVHEEEIYRIMSAAFVHGGIFHIAMNMSSLLQLGMTMEVQFGSLQFLFLSLWSVVLVGVLYVTLCWILSFAFGPSQLIASAVGYSGVLFTYAVIEANHTVEASRSMFGMFNVPAKLMPFVLLVLLQLLLPNVSMVGHLAGVIVGLAAVGGLLNVFMPSEAFFEYVEQIPTVAGMINRVPSYVRCTGRSMTLTNTGGGSSGGIVGACAAAWGGASWVFVQVWNVVATILHIVGLGSMADAMCVKLSRCTAPIAGAFNSCFRPSPSASAVDAAHTNGHSNGAGAACASGASDEVELTGSAPTGSSTFRTLRGVAHNGPPPLPGVSGGSGSGGNVYTPLNQNVTEV